MSQARLNVIADLVFEVAIGALLFALFSSGACTSVGACVFPPHANLCDPGDFDPKCLVGKCAPRDGGP